MEATIEKTAGSAPARDQYDPPWKTVIEHQLAQFLAFFAPRAFAEVDWSRKPVSLNTELRRWRRDSAAPDRHADSLFKVWLKSGDERYVLIHVEVQSGEDGSFAERMFEYGYRSWDRHRRKLAAIAILGDDSPSFRPDHFGWELWDTEMIYRFPAIKLLDWRERREEFAASTNIFAVVVEAYLATRETRKDAEARRLAKWRLVRLLYERKYSREEVVSLFALIDWMLHLPEEQAIIFEADLESLEAEHDMRYLTSIERRALARGIEQGMEKGLEKGMEKGLEKGLERGRQEQLRTLLEHRFGSLPVWTLERLGSGSPRLLDSWAVRLLEARSLEEVFG